MANNDSASAATPEPIRLTMRDWRIEEDATEDMQPGDDAEFQIEFSPGNQSYLQITDANNEPVMGMIIEINNGVPALHISMNGDCNLLHAHVINESIVLTPDHHRDRFQTVAPDRYNYFSTNAMELRNDQ